MCVADCVVSFPQTGFKEGRSTGTDEGLNAGFAEGLIEGAQVGYSWGQLWGLQRFRIVGLAHLSSSIISIQETPGASRECIEDFLSKNKPSILPTTWGDAFAEELQRVREEFSGAHIEPPTHYQLKTNINKSTS